ncbi:hypothetical protein HT031_003110 [Scenedesmus sp. PABB004]|nr:hypothetical protein HT031_003110 [Scenedesmus sp. PABB004]
MQLAWADARAVLCGLSFLTYLWLGVATEDEDNEWRAAVSAADAAGLPTAKRSGLVAARKRYSQRVMEAMRKPEHLGHGVLTLPAAFVHGFPINVLERDVGDDEKVVFDLLFYTHKFDVVDTPCAARGGARARTAGRAAGRTAKRSTPAHARAHTPARARRASRNIGLEFSEAAGSWDKFSHRSPVVVAKNAEGLAIELAPWAGRRRIKITPGARGAPLARGGQQAPAEEEEEEEEEEESDGDSGCERPARPRGAERARRRPPQPRPRPEPRAVSCPWPRSDGFVRVDLSESDVEYLISVETPPTPSPGTPSPPVPLPPTPAPPTPSPSTPALAPPLPLAPAQPTPPADDPPVEPADDPPVEPADDPPEEPPPPVDEECWWPMKALLLGRSRLAELPALLYRSVAGRGEAAALPDDWALLASCAAQARQPEPVREVLTRQQRTKLDAGSDQQSRSSPANASSQRTPTPRPRRRRRVRAMAADERRIAAAIKARAGEFFEQKECVASSSAPAAPWTLSLKRLARARQQARPSGRAPGRLGVRVAVRVAF